MQETKIEHAGCCESVPKNKKYSIKKKERLKKKNPQHGKGKKTTTLLHLIQEQGCFFQHKYVVSFQTLRSLPWRV